MTGTQSPEYSEALAVEANLAYNSYLEICKLIGGKDFKKSEFLKKYIGDDNFRHEVKSTLFGYANIGLVNRKNIDKISEIAYLRNNILL